MAPPMVSSGLSLTQPMTAAGSSRANIRPVLMTTSSIVIRPVSTPVAAGAEYISSS